MAEALLFIVCSIICFFHHDHDPHRSFSLTIFLCHRCIYYMYVQCLNYCPVVLKNDEGYPRAKCWFDEEQQ